MLPEYLRTKSDSLAQINTAMAEIQIFFLRDCFFIGAPCIYTVNFIESWNVGRSL